MLIQNRYIIVLRLWVFKFSNMFVPKEFTKQLKTQDYILDPIDVNLSSSICNEEQIKDLTNEND